MPTCPGGHDSSTGDYCDECGAPIGPRPATEQTNRSRRTEQLGSSAGSDDERCPACSTRRNDRDRFCEGCGHDFTSAPSAEARPRRGWTAEVGPDRAYYDRVSPDGLAFPDDAAPRVFLLTDDEVTIGRRSASRDVQAGIDLADPGVSHRHAKLVRVENGGYEVVDTDSTNGTLLNDDPTPLAAETSVRVVDGDRIHVGAWTTITIRRSAP